jgi:hypothetical protein
MVTSVMAIGGLGSAAIASSDVILSDSEPTPGSAVTVTVTATPDDGTSGFSFTHEFNQSVGSASDLTVQAAGSTVNPIIGQANADGATVTLGSGDVTAGEQITIEYTITTEGTDGKTVSITGDVTNRIQEDLPERSYTTTASPTSPINVTRNISAEEVLPGEEVRVTTEVSGVSESVSTTSSYDPEVASATIQSVTVNGASANPLIEEASQNGSTVTVDVGTDSTVTITETLTVGSETDVTHSITGDVTAGEATAEADPVSVTVISVVDKYDADNNGDISIIELGQAGQAYADGELTIIQLGAVGAAYTS